MINNIDKLFSRYRGKYPDPPGQEKVIELIDKIKELDLAKCQISYIRYFLDKLMYCYLIRTSIVYTVRPLYRGILYSSKPLNVSQLSYPPVEFAKINRASNSGQQMFYSATNPITPLYELGVEVGDRLVLSTWRVKKELRCNNVGFTKENFQKLNSLRADISMPNNYNSYNLIL